MEAVFAGGWIAVVTYLVPLGDQWFPRPSETPTLQHGWSESVPPSKSNAVFHGRNNIFQVFANSLPSWQTGIPTSKTYTRLTVVNQLLVAARPAGFEPTTCDLEDYGLSHDDALQAPARGHATSGPDVSRGRAAARP